MRRLFIPWLFLFPLICLGQVGIGTTTPSTKAILDLSSTTQGFLIPRMTALQRSALQLTAEDVGMMVFQTNTSPDPPPSPKGLYYFDGANWIVPITNGTVNGQTLRWDGNKWINTSNLFNQGSSIGIGTTNPNSQLHLHSSSIPNTRIQLTNTTTGASSADGLMMGVALSNGNAHVSQNENRSLWFGTNGMERMRIDSLGRLGIGLNDPQAMLDVHGTVRIGTSGTILNGIIKRSIEVEIPALNFMGEGYVDVEFEGAIETGAVYVSPASPMSGLMIGYARVIEPGSLEIKFMNMGPNMAAPMTIMLYISVIQ